MPCFDRTRSERGAMSIEFLLVMSMLMVVFLVMLQYAVKAHAQRVATAAAEEAVAAAAAYDGTADDGEATGTHYLEDRGPELSNATVVVTRNQATASATISGDVEQLIPFLPVHITVRITGPVEQFVNSP